MFFKLHFVYFVLFAKAYGFCLRAQAVNSDFILNVLETVKFVFCFLGQSVKEKTKHYNDKTREDLPAMRKTSSKGTLPAAAFDVDADRVEWLLKTLVLIPVHTKMDLTLRTIEQRLTSLCGL